MPDRIITPWCGLMALLVIGLLAGCGNEERPVEIENVERVPAESAERRPDSPIGDTISQFPDTGLVDRFGDPVSFDEFVGRPVIVSSVYTRCPQARMCPLQTRKMARLQRRVNRPGETPVQFVMVSFDPAHDTPTVLRKYGRRYDIEYETWTFVTGDSETVDRLMERMNVTATRTEPGVYVHNLRLYVTDENGVVRHVFRGNDWQIDDVETVLNGIRS